MISTRLPVGATRSIAWRDMIDRRGLPEQLDLAAGAAAQLFVLALEAGRLDGALARCSSRRSALNGFSMKS